MSFSSSRATLPPAFGFFDIDFSPFTFRFAGARCLRRYARGTQQVSVSRSMINAMFCYVQTIAALTTPDDNGVQRYGVHGLFTAVHSLVRLPL